VILLLQFRSAFCPHVDLGFDRSASAPPFVQVLLGVFVSGSGLHRQIWKYVALVYANYAFSFFHPRRRRLSFNLLFVLGIPMPGNGP